MIKITAKTIMERLNRIEEAINDEKDADDLDRTLRESKIRQQMRVDTAEKLIAEDVDLQKIGRATGLSIAFLAEIEERKKSGDI